MAEFSYLKLQIEQQFDKLSKLDLFVTDIDKDTLWETYLASFPEGTNPIYRERTSHDCQCCKQFIRACGNVVAIIDGRLVSIWDIEIDNYYQTVADAMSRLVKSKPIKDVFIHYEKTLGTNFNHQLLEDGQVKIWEHFYYKLPSRFVCLKDYIGSTLSEKRSNKEVFERSLEEITIKAAETVLELIEQKSLYRGDEFKSIVELFITCKREHNETSISKKNYYCWLKSISLGPAAKFRNTVIGTLLSDISGGKSLDDAVRLFESKVAPTNYKRPTALIINVRLP